MQSYTISKIKEIKVGKYILKKVGKYIKLSNNIVTNSCIIFF